MTYDARLMSGQVETQLRRLLLALLTVGFVSVSADLVFLGHYEDPLQLIPLGVGGAALAVILWQAVAPGAASLGALRLVMLVVVVTGVVGIVLHFRGNMEFQTEINPDLTGLELVTKVLHAKTPPALAPGVMVQLGLLGLIYSFRHPCARSQSSGASL